MRTALLGEDKAPRYGDGLTTLLLEHTAPIAINGNMDHVERILHEAILTLPDIGTNYRPYLSLPRDPKEYLVDPNTVEWKY